MRVSSETELTAIFAVQTIRNTNLFYDHPRSTTRARKCASERERGPRKLHSLSCGSRMGAIGDRRCVDLVVPTDRHMQVVTGVVAVIVLDCSQRANQSAITHGVHATMQRLQHYNHSQRQKQRVESADGMPELSRSLCNNSN